MHSDTRYFLSGIQKSEKARNPVIFKLAGWQQLMNSLMANRFVSPLLFWLFISVLFYQRYV
jgi:hypothetical protein